MLTFQIPSQCQVDLLWFKVKVEVSGQGRDAVCLSSELEVELSGDLDGLARHDLQGHGETSLGRQRQFGEHDTGQLVKVNWEVNSHGGWVKGQEVQRS